MRKFFIIIILFFPLTSFAGDIDGKGLVCGPGGYFFDNDIHTFHHVRNGDLIKTNKGKYSTTPKKIYIINTLDILVPIERRNPQVKINNTWYDCKIAIGYSSFMEMLKTNLENITKNNKI